MSLGNMNVMGPVAARLRGRAAAIAVACSSLFGACSVGYAAEFNPVSVGHDLVSTYCADCHATERTGDSPLAAAPHFRDLHLRYEVENLSEALVEGIVTAHDEMPEFEFDPYQAAAIVAYLKSLESLPK